MAIPSPLPRPVRAVAAWAPALALMLAVAGCASVEAERGFDDVRAITAPKLGTAPRWLRSPEEEQAARREIRETLAKPLTAEAAVTVALLGNRGLQAAYAELGIAAADLAQASRPPNPSISYARLTRGDEVEIDRTVSINLFRLLLLPVTHAIEERRFEQGRLLAAERVLRTAADVRRAWIEAVAAAEAAAFADRTLDAAATQAELARRMRRAGNWSLLDQAREQAFYAEAAADRARARFAAEAARGRLARLMGLWGGEAWGGEARGGEGKGGDAPFTLPDRLPDLPAAPAADAPIEAQAMRERLDLKRARSEVAGLAASLGLTRVTRFVDVLETSWMRNSESGRPLQQGYQVTLEIPLFDWGDAKVAKAEFIYANAVERLAEMATDARTEVRTAWLAYRTAWDIAHHYRAEILPVRQQIADELVLRYNGMQVSVFELLADAREQIRSVAAAIEAERDFRIAEVDLAFVTSTGTTSTGITSIGAAGGIAAAPSP